MLVDCNEKHFRIAGLRGLLHFEEGGSKGGPTVDHFEERYFRVLRTHT